MSQAEAVSSPCRPLTNRPPVPDGTTLHYAVASTEAKLVFSDSTREATHAFGGLDILESADWRFSRNDAHTSTELFPLFSGFAQGKSVGNKYEIRTSAPRRSEPRPSPSTLGREKRTFSTGRSDTIRRRATRPKARARAPNRLHIPPLPTDSPAVHDARRRDPDATHTVTRSRSHFICDTAVFDAQESSGER